jgi:hypothetical protein
MDIDVVLATLELVASNGGSSSPSSWSLSSSSFAFHRTVIHRDKPLWPAGAVISLSKSFLFLKNKNYHHKPKQQYCTLN